MPMKLTLSDILALLFVLLLSLVLKKIFFLPLALIALIFVFGGRLKSGHKNLAYILALTATFLPFFIFFAFYLPFVVFGAFLSNRTFIKSYVLGTAIILILRIFLYHANMLGFPLTEWTILFVIFFFIVIAYSIFIKKYGVAKVQELFIVDSREFKILAGTLFFLFFVGSVLYNNSSLYASNGTQIYAKQKFVIDSIEKFGKFPLYDPGIGMGEQLFLTDSQTHFTKDILVLATIWLKRWFGEVLLYNAYHMFILWLTILGASILLREILSRNGEDNSALTPYFVVLGSIAIGLSFVFVRLLESFKAFSAHPINMLIFALLISRPKKPIEWFVIAYLMLFSYMVHAIQAIGVFFLALSILIIMYARDIPSIKSAIAYLFSHKLKGLAIVFIFILVMFGYTATGYLTKNYIRESSPGFFQPNPIANSIGYFEAFLYKNPDVTPFSIKYPNLARLDTKHSGFFLSVIGGISFLILLFAIGNERFRKAGLFNWAIMLQFLLYGLFTNFINIGNLEPGYRIVLPYMVVALAISFCAMGDALNDRRIKAAFALICLLFLIHSFYYVKINISNVHSSSIISGNVFPDLIQAINQVPIDGRFITYGMFSNEVDAGIASVTGRYFTRYQYNLWSAKNNLYEKVHTQHSFGDFPNLPSLSGTELRNYWDLGGYRYVLFNACHPIGNLVFQKTYPNQTQPLFQSQQNQCLIISRVNNVSYAEKVSVIPNVSEEVYAQEGGSIYFTLSDLPRYSFGRNEALKGAPSEPSPP